MSEANKQIVARWFREFWGNPWNPAVVSELATRNVVLHYSMHESKVGRAAVTEFISDFRGAFPDLNFWPIDDLIAEGDRVVVRWKGGGTHTGCAFHDFRMGSLVAASGHTMRFSGTTIFRLEDQRIAEELGQEDALTAMWQLRMFRAPEAILASAIERAAEKASVPFEGFGSNFGPRPVKSALPHGWNRLTSREGEF
jgi:predicted ester cyclase